MQNETRRLILAMAVMLLALFGYQAVFNRFFPPPKPPAPGTPAAPTAAQPQPATSATSASTAAAGSGAVTPPATASGPVFTIASAENLAPVPFGGRDGDALRMELNPRGAALMWLDLFAKDPSGHFVNREHSRGSEPHRLLASIPESGWERYSFATPRVWIRFPGQNQTDQSWLLDDVIWTAVEPTLQRVVFSTALRAKETGADVLRLTKTFELNDGQPVFELRLALENASTDPLTVWVEQDGPIGMCREDEQGDVPALLVTQYKDGVVEPNKSHQRAELRKATQAGEPVKLTLPDKGPLAWTVLANKYFGVFTRPVPVGDQPQQDYVSAVMGVVAAPQSEDKNLGDLVARLETKPVQLQPGARVQYPFEVYAGAKDADHLRGVNPAYAGKDKLHYEISQVTSQRCCSFLWLQNLMIGLLEWIHAGVRNYGVAIMILVVIVRAILHPLAVFQQKNMFRMQESMARIQPKMQAVKERYANDKARLNQEMMKVWGEEGVNPLGQMTAFLPLFLQMPILIALWTGLSLDVNLRHAPFDGYWIHDLAAPDAILTFAPVEIPLLSWFMGPITALNLLPALMGISMWLQQKYMPKPAMSAKLQAAKDQAAAGKSKSGLSPQDQLRQQQMMAYMMAILFPLMFYKMPAGLNLYWMATNVFGIGESLIIRKQIAKERKRREEQGPRPPPKRTGLLSRFFKHIAAQAEELQKKADQVTRLDGPKAPPPDSRPGSGPPPRPASGSDARKRKKR